MFKWCKFSASCPYCYSSPRMVLSELVILYQFCSRPFLYESTPLVEIKCTGQWKPEGWRQGGVTNCYGWESNLSAGGEKKKGARTEWNHPVHWGCKLKMVMAIQRITKKISRKLNDISSNKRRKKEAQHTYAKTAPTAQSTHWDPAHVL